MRLDDEDSTKLTAQAAAHGLKLASGLHLLAGDLPSIVGSTGARQAFGCAVVVAETTAAQQVVSFLPAVARRCSRSRAAREAGL